MNQTPMNELIRQLEKTLKVYLYDNMCFVTGFAIRKKDEPKITIPRER